MKQFFSRYRNISVTAALCCFFCYFYLMINGHAGPDATSEGVHFYRNADWATQCGRWMIRYLNELFGKNAIIPFIIVIAYCAMIALSAMLLCEMLPIRKRSAQVLLSAALVSFPVISVQFGYLYMALSYSFSFLTVTAGYYLLRMRKLPAFFGAVLCFLLMLGSFQAYIGALAAMGLLFFLSDLLREKELKKALSDLGAAVGAAAIACVLNFAVMEVMLRIYKLGAADRVESFSVAAIFENLSFSLKYSYVWFFTPFWDADVLFRRKLYLLFFALILIAAGGCLWVLIAGLKETKKRPLQDLIRPVLFVPAFLLLPLAMNVCVVLFPTNGIYAVMQYHYALIFPLFFVLSEYCSEKLSFRPFGKALGFGGSGALFVLICTWTLSANATWILNGLIYDHCLQQATLMIGQVYELDDYHYRETPVVLGGAIDYSDLRGIYAMLFRYAKMGAGPIFWENPYGMTQGRYHFFREYMGFDARWISQDEYLAVVNSEEYRLMPVWPEKGSVAMINGYAVIKNSEEPPGLE
ncbi:MAG: glucosyltransferase domain-containing protein [Lachnospiraceae bacterium]|nr:glucosyltransferase domain-containing protein [Lachnospiraceae bacterium]